MWNSLKTISTLRVCMSRLKEPCWSTHCARPPTFLDALLTCCCVCVSYALSARSLKTTCTANTWVLRYPATACSLRCSMPSAAGHEDSEALWWSTLIYGSIKLWCMSKTMRLSWVFPFLREPNQYIYCQYYQMILAHHRYIYIGVYVAQYTIWKHLIDFNVENRHVGWFSH